MNALKILNKLSEELKETYKTKADFENWTPVNNNIGIVHGKIDYFVDYSILGHREVMAKLTVYKTIKGKTYKYDFDKDVKAYIERSIELLLPLLYDQREAEQEEAEKELKASIEYEQQMKEAVLNS